MILLHLGLGVSTANLQSGEETLFSCFFTFPLLVISTKGRPISPDSLSHVTGRYFMRKQHEPSESGSYTSYTYINNTNS